MSEVVSDALTERTAERANFELFMTKHVASLMDFAGRYVRRLPALQRELFLDRALRAAWEKRHEFVPGVEEGGLLVWWETCLVVAARSRECWTQVYQDDVRIVSGAELGK